MGITSIYHLSCLRRHRFRASFRGFLSIIVTSLVFSTTFFILLLYTSKLDDVIDHHRIKRIALESTTISANPVDPRAMEKLPIKTAPLVDQQLANVNGTANYSSLPHHRQVQMASNGTYDNNI